MPSIPSFLLADARKVDETIGQTKLLGLKNGEERRRRQKLFSFCYFPNFYPLKKVAPVGSDPVMLGIKLDLTDRAFHVQSSVPIFNLSSISRQLSLIGQNYGTLRIKYVWGETLRMKLINPPNFEDEKCIFPKKQPLITSLC